MLNFIHTMKRKTNLLYSKCYLWVDEAKERNNYKRYYEYYQKQEKNDIKRVTDMTVNSLNILIITFIKSVKKIFFAHHLIRKLSICYKHIIHEYSIAFIILDRNCFMRTSPVPFEMIFLLVELPFAC